MRDRFWLTDTVYLDMRNPKLCKDNEREMIPMGNKQWIILKTLAELYQKDEYVHVCRLIIEYFPEEYPDKEEAIRKAENPEKYYEEFNIENRVDNIFQNLKKVKQSIYNFCSDNEFEIESKKNKTLYRINTKFNNPWTKDSKKINLFDSSYKLSSVPLFRRPFFIKDSRKDIFEKLNHAFENTYKSSTPNVVILTGPGGYGKTELAKEYAEEGLRNNFFKYIIYSRFDKNQKRDKDFKNIITNDNLIRLSGFERKIDDDDETYYNRKLTTLLESQKKETLYIIDNYDAPDHEVERLVNGEYGNINLSLLIISREPMEDYPFERVSVGTLENEKHLIELFQKNVKSTYRFLNELTSEENIKLIKKINSLVQNHTLAIEILAKSLPTNKRLVTYYEELTAADGHIFENMKAQVRAGENYSRIPLEIIKRLFKISKLQEMYDKEYLQQILTFFYGLPLQGISTGISIIGDIEDDYYDIIEALINRGWLSVDESSNLIYLHALVRETVFDFYKNSDTSTLEINNCSLILEKYIVNNKNFVNSFYHSVFSSKVELAKFITSFIKTFPYNENSSWIYSHNFYIKVVQALIYCNEWALSENLIIDMLTSGINGFKEGYLYYLLGKVTFFYRRVPRQADRYFEKAATIMESVAILSTDEKVELAMFYKDCASILIESLSGYIKEDTKDIEKLLEKAENNIASIHSKDVDRDEFIKAINIWKAYLFAYNENFEEVENILSNESYKEDNFSEIDKSTIWSTNALIYRKKGNFHNEAILLEKALRISEKYFGRNRKGNEEKYTAIYKAYKNDENWEEALRIAMEGRAIVQEIYGAQVNEKGRAAEAFYSFSDRIDEARQNIVHDVLLKH